MADSAGDLTFSFGADFSGFTREVESAGRKLDALRQAAAAAPLQLSSGLSQAATALRSGSGLDIAALAGGDAAATKTLSHLTDQLALLQTTGAAHDAIVERMKIEAEQAKLGTDATTAQKQAVAALVTQIDAAKASQKTLAGQQEALNDAWDFGAEAVSRGLGALLVRGQSLQSVARSLLATFAQQGLSGALAGTGAFAGLFGTAGRSGQTGGLFGVLQGLFSGGLGGGSLSSLNAAFSGLYADGGTIGAGRWGIVGEKGAEVVAGPATVVPWARMNAAGAGRQATHQTITFNVTSPDAPSFARSETQIAAMLSRAAQRGQRNA